MRNFLLRNLARPGELTADMVRWFKSPQEQADLWKDCLDTEKKLGFLRQSDAYPAPQGEDKVALIASLSDWPYQLKIEAMLGVGLRKAGWQVRVLMRKPKDRWARRYFEAFGLEDYVYWSDYGLDAEEKADAVQSQDAFLEEPLTFTGVKSWIYRQCWIGPQILASISRGMRQGAFDLSDPVVVQEIKRWLPQTLETVLLAQKIIKDVHPAVMYVMEPNYAKNGPLTDTAIAMGVDVLRISVVARDHSVMLRRLTTESRREHPSTVSKKTWEQLQKEPWTPQWEKELQDVLETRYNGTWFLQARNQPNTKKVEREEIFSSLKLDPNKKVAVVFSHVLWDANLFYGEDLFEDYGDWFVQTVDAAVKNPAVNWIIKLHPANAWKRHREGATDELSELGLIRKHICDPDQLPSHVVLLPPDTQIGTDSLMRVLDYGVTVRGTISVELPCFGIPVFTAGTGRCHGFGFTIDSESCEEYLQRMATIQNYPRLGDDLTLKAKRFAHAVFCRRPWLMESFQSKCFVSPKGKHILDFNIVPVATSWSEIEKNGDLKKWSDWVARRGEVDYLGY